MELSERIGNINHFWDQVESNEKSYRLQKITKRILIERSNKKLKRAEESKSET